MMDVSRLLFFLLLSAMVSLIPGPAMLHVITTG